MNSDPTGYFTLAGLSGAISVENILRNAYISSIAGGFLSFFDALVGGERDAAALMDSFKQGAISGAVAGAFFSSVAAFGNINCLTSLTTKLSLGTAATYFGVEGAQGAAQSFKEGKIIQGIYRMILSLISFVGAGKSYGEALKTADAINNGSTCFVAGTLVLTDDGEKPIEDIEVGDHVYASDPETGENAYKEVLNVFIRQSNIIIHVFVNGEEIETTPTHPFWVENEWVTADKLKAGDVLTRADGTTCAIDRVYAEFSNKAITVYNFEVADFIQVHLDEYFLHRFVDLLLGKLVKTEFGVEVEVLIHRQFLNQEVVLRHIADNALELFALFGVVVAVDGDSAALERVIADEEVQERRFAHAGAAHDADEVARLLKERGCRFWSLDNGILCCRRKILSLPFVRRV